MLRDFPFTCWTVTSTRLYRSAYSRTYIHGGHAVIKNEVSSTCVKRTRSAPRIQSLGTQGRDKGVRSRRLRPREDDRAVAARREYTRNRLTRPGAGKTGGGKSHPRFPGPLEAQELRHDRNYNRSEFYRTMLSCLSRHRHHDGDGSGVQSEKMTSLLRDDSTTHLQPKRTET